MSTRALVLLALTCLGCGDSAPGKPPSSAPGGASGVGGQAGAASGGASSGAGTAAGAGTSATGGGAGEATAGSGGSEPLLPGFDTDREIVDFGAVSGREQVCSGAGNDTAAIARVWLAQTHLMEPTADDWTQRDDGATLVEEAQRPKFRLISHRPALLKVDVTGSGAAPEVRVVASRDGSELGALCLSGPATLAGAAPSTPALDDSFTVSLPAAWIRPGLSLSITAGATTTTVPASDLRVAGGLEQTIVEVPLLLFGNTAPLLVTPRFAPELAACSPFSKLTWGRFPVDVPLDPLIVEDGTHITSPDQPLPDSFDLIRIAIDTAGLLQRANGLSSEAKFFGSLDRDQGGGLGGGDAAGGDPSAGIFHHELGHTYGLPHLADWYGEYRYPFGGGDPGGGSVGPHWAYDQLSETFLTPFSSGATEKQDPMQGGGGAQEEGRAVMFFSTYSNQAILDHFQDRIFFDEPSAQYRRWDDASGDFLAVSDEEVGGFEGLPAERDVPVFTIHGTHWTDHPAADSIQPLLHYRGHLPRLVTVTDEDLGWLADHPNEVCYWGCDYAVRVEYASGKIDGFVLQLDTKDHLRRWALNVPGDEPLVKVEAFHRPLHNRAGEGDAPEHVSQTTAASYFDGHVPFATHEP